MIKIPNECLIEIFNNFQEDYITLFSCLLVSRQWCRIIVPILWSRPTDDFGDKRIIRIYLFALNVEEQALLIPFNIILPKNYPKPLFEYSTYTTSIGFYLTEGIENWLIDEGYGTDKSHYSIIIDYERVDDDDEPVSAVKCSLIKMLLRTSKKIKYFSLTKTNNKLIFENLYANTTITELSIEDIHFDSAEIKELMEFISLYDYKVKYKKINGLWKLLSHHIS
ncbi:f-box domain-containing protein [Gigaspora margarita]|uniref:F-box domain-containing protein n=1 Tax=Gigaspora margarita TaxID=4874 RepID=A0A8H4AKE7_GIGMA|nr:f-box domain-containing protein [Gigaspora margarita]